MPPCPSEIAAQKQNAKKKEKVVARQVSSSTEVITPDIADDITDSKLQWSSKKKVLERKVWNDTTSNNHKCAPTVTELLSAPATKSVKKTQKAVKKTQKVVEGGGCERSNVASILTSHNAILNPISCFVPPHLASCSSDSIATASMWDDDDLVGQLIMVTADSVKVKCKPNEKKRSKLEGNTAYEHKERAILKRLKHNTDFAVALASIPEGCLSAFCTGIEKLTHQTVVSQFTLRRGCSNKVEELLKSHKYIFPTNQNGKVLGDQPFCDEAMINTLHQSLFNGKNLIGVQLHEDFVLVLDGNDEPELPIAMVALIATVVVVADLCYTDRLEGSNPPLSSQVKLFNATVYISVYKAHEATLTQIFEGGKKSITC
ncbi:hypothetical protein BDR06DRAFT_975295 [Suillus hirtellus]|nr:hypothetical protein BDR06DRAFT_975295 [Suillus hirtellus]